MSLRALCVGLSCLEYVWQLEALELGARRPALAHRVQGGGGAATAAVTFVRLGGASALVSLHGDDAAGALARAELEAQGVDCRWLQRVGGQTATAALLVDGRGGRWVVPYLPSELTAAPATPFEVAGFDVLLSDGCYPQLAEPILQAAQARRLPIVMSLSSAREALLAGYADYLLLSEACAVALLGRNDPEAALDALRQHPAQTVGITLGEEGFLYGSSAHPRHLPALPVAVRNTAGAGAVFHGAFGFAVASGWALDDCAIFAAVTAALSCQAPSARSGIPTAAQVLTLLEQRTLRELGDSAIL